MLFLTPNQCKSAEGTLQINHLNIFLISSSPTFHWSYNLTLTNLVVALPCDSAVQIASHANLLDLRPNLHRDTRLILRINCHTIATCLLNTYIWHDTCMVVSIHTPWQSSHSSAINFWSPSCVVELQHCIISATINVIVSIYSVSKISCQMSAIVTKQCYVIKSD